MCREPEAIEKEEMGIFTMEIYPDQSPDSPMSWGWPVKLIHSRYNLESEDPRVIIQEHGNIWYSQVPTQERGWTYVIASKSDWIDAMKKGEKDAAYHGWDPTKKGMQAMVDNMADLVRQYHEGDVYEYVIKVTDTQEVKESVCGYYGLRDAIKEARAALKNLHEQEQEAERFEQSAMAI